MSADKIKVNGRTYTIHRVNHARDTLLIYRWSDVVAHEVTCATVAYFLPPRT